MPSDATHPIIKHLRGAANHARIARELEAKLYAPGNPDVQPLTEAEATEAHKIIDQLLHSLLGIEGVADRVAEMLGGDFE